MKRQCKNTSRTHCSTTEIGGSMCLSGKKITEQINDATKQFREGRTNQLQAWRVAINNNREEINKIKKINTEKL